MNFKLKLTYNGIISNDIVNYAWSYRFNFGIYLTRKLVTL